MATHLRLSTKKQLLTLLRQRATAEWDSGIAASFRQLEREAPQEAAQAKVLLQQVAGRTSPSSAKAMKQLTLQGVLPGLPPSLVEKLYGPGASKGYRRPLAGALASAIRGDLDEVIKSVVNKKPEMYVPLLQDLGQPDANQWAAWLQKAVMWAPKTGDRLAGQVATLSGQLFQRRRKATLTHRAADQESSKVVAAYNRTILERATRQPHGGKVEPLTRELRERLAFGEPRFHEGMTDGDNKELTDGMHLSFNRNGELLVARIEEDKLASVGADAIPQIDADIDRIRKRGIRLADGRYFPPEKVKLPVSPTAGAQPTQLVAYVEGAKPREMLTPNGYRVTIVGVDSANDREFVRDLLIEWRRRLASTRVRR
jgi:hypothetical protein